MPAPEQPSAPKADKPHGGTSLAWLHLGFGGIFKPRFAAGFCYGPFLVALLLNPGKNGRNLPQFAAWEVLLLAVCGCLMVVGAIAGLFPARTFQFAYRSRWFEVEPHYTTFLFLLIMGCLTLYFASLGFQVQWGTASD